MSTLCKVLYYAWFQAPRGLGGEEGVLERVLCRSGGQGRLLYTNIDHR